MLAQQADWCYCMVMHIGEELGCREAQFVEGLVMCGRPSGETTGNEKTTEKVVSGVRW